MVRNNVTDPINLQSGGGAMMQLEEIGGQDTFIASYTFWVI